MTDTQPHTGYRSLYAYPWDVHDTGVARFVDQALALGLNGVTLAASYHTGKFLRPHARSGGRVVFPQDGAVYFNPDPSRYGMLAAQPHDDPAMRQALGALLADGRLSVHGWTVALHNSWLGALYPQFTARNAFGDGYVYSLCPMQSAVFDYAVALCLDVAAQGVASVVVETPGWLPYAHGYHHEFAQVRSNAWLDTMLGLCFCDACVKAGQTEGIDMVHLQEQVAARIDGYLDAPVDASADQAAAWLAADLHHDTELAALVRLRQRRVTDLVTTIRGALPTHTALAVIPTVQRPTAACWQEGSDLAALAQAADWLEVPFYEPDAQRTVADALDTLRRVGGPAKVRAILRPGPPDLADGAQLDAALAGLAQLGLRDFAFYNYGLLRRSRLDAIGTALHAFDGSAP